VPPDTAGADTAAAVVLSPRERALERLRSLPTTPIQRDTVAGDTLAADPEADDVTEGADPDVAEDPDGVLADAGVIVVRPMPWTPDTADVALEEASIRAMLARLDGYVTTEYRGEAAVFEGVGNRLRLTGESKVNREGNAIEADSALVYAGDTGIVCGYGNPVLSGDADPVESDRVCYDINRGLGVAEGARTQFVQGGTWFVRGPQNRVYLLNREESHELYGHNTQFTSCDLPEPHYVFQARSLKMVEGDVMVARNVTLRFEDVPVFWLPWMVQSMKPDRRSGLLTPQFGVNDIVRNQDRDRYARRISNLGFYWAINDYVSALAAFQWFSNNYSAVEGNLTYRWTRQFLEGRLAVTQYWMEGGSRNMSLSTNNSWRPDERTQVQVSGDYATSTSMVRDYSFDPRELTQRISSNASINRSFGWGSMSLGARRQQQITDDRIDWTLPSLSANVRPLTLFSNEDGTRSLTLSGSGQASRTMIEVNPELTPTARGQETTTASGNYSLSLGRFSLRQSATFRDHVQDRRFANDTLDIPALPGVNEQEFGWDTGLSFQHTLWPGTTVSPQISVRGRQIRNDQFLHFGGDRFIAEPTRLSAGASLGTTLFGFWPGFGEYSRIRHKISPSLTWNYSPSPTISPVQDSVFGLRDLREQNRIGLSFNQTFEAKVDDGDENGATENGEADEADLTGEPRRLPRSRTINLLSINTTPSFQYDFVRAREEGRGFMTEDITNSIKSDLVPGLQLTMSHHLFSYGDEAPAPGELASRSFSPTLTRLNTSFSIDRGFWLFRMLGLDRPAGDDAVNGEPEDPGFEDDEFDLDGRDPGAGGMVPRLGDRSTMAPRTTGGGWRASLTYSFNRPAPRPGAMPLARTQQTVNGSLNFQPTEHWNVNWNTSYSFTTSQFDTHVLTLSRDLHRWQANFDFIKAPNGNFAMQFRVHLLDNPDLKVDYDQRTNPSEQRLNMSQP